MKGATHFTVSFDLECSGPDPTTGDIRDALSEFFAHDVLTGVVSNFHVRIDHEKEDTARHQRTSALACSSCQGGNSFFRPSHGTWLCDNCWQMVARR